MCGSVRQLLLQVSVQLAGRCDTDLCENDGQAVSLDLQLKAISLIRPQTEPIQPQTVTEDTSTQENSGLVYKGEVHMYKGQLILHGLSPTEFYVTSSIQLGLEGSFWVFKN